jgi:hypothetical protein
VLILVPPVVTRESVGQPDGWGTGETTARQNGRVTAVRAPERRPFRAVGGLKWLVGYAAFGLGISTLYATTGVGFPCPFRALTGWECPFCGGTRLGSALLHGDVTSAFAYNPVIFVSLVLGVVIGALWILEALGGPRVRPPKSWLAAVGRLRPGLWWVGAGGLAAIFVLLRNLA